MKRCVGCLCLPLLSESFFRHKARAAADSTPAQATPARSASLPAPRPSPPLLPSQYLSLLRPLVASAAQELRRFSKLDSHLGARWWYCSDGVTPAPADSSAKIPLLETREVDTMGLRLASVGASRMTWHAAPFALVWSTRAHGDRLRDLRDISLVGTDDNMAINSPKTKWRWNPQSDRDSRGKRRLCRPRSSVSHNAAAAATTTATPRFTGIYSQTGTKTTASRRRRVDVARMCGAFWEMSFYWKLLRCKTCTWTSRLCRLSRVFTAKLCHCSLNYY